MTLPENFYSYARLRHIPYVHSVGPKKPRNNIFFQESVKNKDVSPNFTATLNHITSALQNIKL